MPATADDKKKEAFGLFHEGMYAESLALCNRLIETARDPAIEILAATNLFSLGKLEDAEVSFRDLAQLMPESSYVHSYLAKVLEKKGDDNAIAEYAAAVRLDPGNQEALRIYAAWLVERNDERGALPALKRLYQASNRPDDLFQLVTSLTHSGFADAACALCESQGSGKKTGPEYARALCEVGRYKEAEQEAQRLYSETHDVGILRVYLAAHNHVDSVTAPAAYASFLKEVPDPDIYLDYIRLLQDRGEYLRALTAIRKLISINNKPHYRLIACELSAILGDHLNALIEYEKLIRDELDAPTVSESFRQILRAYCRYIDDRFTPAEARERFFTLVPQDTNVICLEETGKMFLESGEIEEAKACYYRAYRADYLHGGLSYAGFLASCDDDRECEKVLLHILANVRKDADLSRVSAAVSEYDSTFQRMRRLTRQLILRLEERRQTLRSDDREFLAAAYRGEAADALSRNDYAACIYDCLCGIDILPAYSKTCHTDDFLSLINQAKELLPTIPPVIISPTANDAVASKETAKTIVDKMGLSDPEIKIVSFLSVHKRATETDLRHLLTTRRVAGIVNLLIRKAKEQGIMLIERKGMSAEGEVYEYCGP